MIVKLKTGSKGGFRWFENVDGVQVVKMTYAEYIQKHGDDIPDNVTRIEINNVGTIHDRDTVAYITFVSGKFGLVEVMTPTKAFLLNDNGDTVDAIFTER
jgi:aspartyl-tRNA synthetase